MKKIAVIVLAALLMISVCAFADSIDATELEGDWYLNTISDEDSYMNVADMGMSMLMTLNADGTLYAQTVMDTEEENDGSWSVSEDTISITLDGQTFSANYYGDSLDVRISEETVYEFTRSQPEPSFVAAAQISADDISDFNGVWSVSTVTSFGSTYPVEEIVDSLEMLFGGSEPIIIVDSGSVCLFGQDDYEAFTLKDGKLYRASDADPEFNEDGILDETIALYEDGTLSYSSLGMTFYCSMI